MLLTVSKHLAQVRHGFLKHDHVLPVEELVEPRRQAHEVRFSRSPHPDTYLRRSFLFAIFFHRRFSSSSKAFRT
jgi:hypothetical protein